MPIVDVHTHYMRPEHWGPEWDVHWAPVYGRPYPNLTPEAFDAVLAPVDRAIVFGLTAHAVGVDTPDEFIAAFVARNRRKYVGFMSLDPTRPEALERMDRGTQTLGLRGIKLYPVLQGFDPSDPAYAPFYERAQRLGLTLLWHFGATPSPVGRLRHSHPLLLEDVAMRFPDLRMIVAHLGHPWQRETALILRKHRHVYADISGLWARTWEGFNALVACVEWGVGDKLLFGSDFPLWTPEEAMQRLRALPAMHAGPGLPRLDPGLIEAIIHRDSLRLLELE